MLLAEPPLTFPLEFLPVNCLTLPFSSGPPARPIPHPPWVHSVPLVPGLTLSWTHVLIDSIKLLHMVSLQLVPYWEKTFDIDLSAPQIGVVNVTDVSFLSSPPAAPQLCFPA